MLSKRTAVSLATLGAIVLTALGVARGASVLLAQPTAVAVVDIQVVFDSAKIREQFKANQQSKAEQLQIVQKEKQQELSAMEQDLKLLKAGTPEHSQLQEDLQRGALEFRLWAEFENAKLIKEQGVQLERLYRDAMSVIGKVAAEQGYDIVLYKEGTPNFRWENPQQLSAQIQLRKLLWSSDTVDITDAVVQRLNNEYNAG